MTPEQIQQKIFYGYAKAAFKLGATFDIYRSSTPIFPIQSGNLISQTQMTVSQTWDYMRANRYGNAVWNACLDAQSADAPNACRVGDYLTPTTGSDVTFYAAGVTIANGGSGYAIGDVIFLGNIANSVILTVLTVSTGGVITSAAITQKGIYTTPLPTNPIIPYWSPETGQNATFNITWTQVGGIDDNSIYFVMVLQFDMPPQVVKCNRTISVIRPSQTTGPGYVGYEGYQPSTSITIMSGMPASVLKRGTTGKVADTKLPTDTNEPIWEILIPNLGGVLLRVDDIIIDDINEEYVVSVQELTELGWRIEALQVVNSR